MLLDSVKNLNKGSFSKYDRDHREFIVFVKNIKDVKYPKNCVFLDGCIYDGSLTKVCRIAQQE